MKNLIRVKMRSALQDLNLALMLKPTLCRCFVQPRLRSIREKQDFVRARDNYQGADRTALRSSIWEFSAARNYPGTKLFKSRRA